MSGLCLSEFPQVSKLARAMGTWKQSAALHAGLNGNQASSDAVTPKLNSEELLGARELSLFT